MKRACGALAVAAIVAHGAFLVRVEERMREEQVLSLQRQALDNVKYDAHDVGAVWELGAAIVECMHTNPLPLAQCLARSVLPETQGRPLWEQAAFWSECHHGTIRDTLFVTDLPNDFDAGTVSLESLMVDVDGGRETELSPVLRAVLQAAILLAEFGPLQSERARRALRVYLLLFNGDYPQACRYAQLLAFQAAGPKGLSDVQVQEGKRGMQLLPQNVKQEVEAWLVRQQFLDKTVRPQGPCGCELIQCIQRTFESMGSEIDATATLHLLNALPVLGLAGTAKKVSSHVIHQVLKKAAEASDFVAKALPLTHHCDAEVFEEIMKAIKATTKVASQDTAWQVYCVPDAGRQKRLSDDLAVAKLPDSAIEPAVLLKRVRDRATVFHSP